MDSCFKSRMTSAKPQKAVAGSTASDFLGCETMTTRPRPPTIINHHHHPGLGAAFFKSGSRNHNQQTALPGPRRTMSSWMDFVRFMFSRERIAAVTSLTEDGAPIFLPQEHIFGRVLPEICVSTVGVTLIFVGFLYLLLDTKPRELRYKLAFRCTNILLYIILIVIGIYGETVVLSELTDNDNVATYVRGLDDETLVLTVVCGFQIWSLVVGRLYFEETALMMWHHIAVLAGSCMYLTFTNGFRYHSFYFAGIWEVSSIPLALMNLFRDQKGWSERYPTVYFLIRLTFALSFLIVRMIISFPHVIRYLTDLYVVTAATADKGVVYHGFMSAVFALSCFLEVLQIYWAGLIVQMLFRHGFRIAKSLLKKDKSQ
eukprot:scaffold5873_cov172-Amphora_coffeaeformis.AAC.6